MGVAASWVGARGWSWEDGRKEGKKEEEEGNLVDSASSHTLVSKIKPCMSKYKRLIR